MKMGVRGRAASRAREGKVTETKIRERRAVGKKINQGRDQTCNEGPKLMEQRELDGKNRTK